MRKRNLILWGIALIAGFLAGSAFHQLIPFRKSNPQETAAKSETHVPAEGKHAEEEQLEEKAVHLDQDEMKEFGVEVKTAGAGKMAIQTTLPGEIVPNADRLVHIVPRVPGVIRKVFKNIGDDVHSEELMAVLESRELADAKASYLAALKRVELAQANAKREEELWRKKISPEQDYLETRNALAEAQITAKNAEQKLHAIGFSESDLAALSSQPDATFTSYEIRAPFGGTIVEKHITIGEVLKEDTVAFTVADMSSVWVKISVYQKDMSLVRKGQRVTISAGYGVPETQGVISYVEPIVKEQTRTAVALVVLPNPKGLFRPGLFVTCRLDLDEFTVPVLIPKTALIQENNRMHIFLETKQGFVLQPITVGRDNDTQIEVLSGIKLGQRYVAQGGFTLKAHLSKGAFGDGHAH
jgi:cobalt-zinc-cadmium efflux system membrane fusion protein